MDTGCWNRKKALLFLKKRTEKTFSVIANPVGGALFRSTLRLTTKTRRTRRYTEVAHGQARCVSPKPKPNHPEVFWFFFSKKNRKEALLF
jgi:hypothetical protein